MRDQSDPTLGGRLTANLAKYEMLLVATELIRLDWRLASIATGVRSRTEEEAGMTADEVEILDAIAVIRDPMFRRGVQILRQAAVGLEARI